MTDIMIWMAVLISAMTANVRPEADADDVPFEAPRYVAQPIPCGPDAPTRSNFVARVAEPFYQRFTVDAFLASPETFAPYAADAERLLREAAFILGNGWPHPMNALYARAEPLVSAGCANPAILWMRAQDLVNRKAHDDAKKQFARLLERLKDAPAPYAPLRALTLNSLRGIDEKMCTEEELAETLAAVLTDGTFSPNETRVAWEFITEWFKMEESQVLLDKLRSSPQPPAPFIMLMLQGKLDYRRAWDARGGGYANTVTEEGWKGYAEFIKDARAVFAQAWELHPDYPEPATGMIDCSRGDRAACRMWFDRAVSAEFDHIPAYGAYAFTIYPRWGGSLSEMLAFAEECRATERHDTEVPFRYVGTLFAIANERADTWKEVFNRPGVYAACTNVIERNLAGSYKARAGVQYNYTALAYCAHAVGDYDTVARATTLGYLGYTRRIRPSPPFNEIAMTLNKAMIGPNKTLMRAAERQAREDDPNTALEALEHIWDDTSLNLTDDERNGVAYLEMELARRIMLASGDWLSLIRPHSARLIDHSWKNYGGRWVFSNMTFRVEGEKALLSSKFFFPHSIEYEVAFMPLPADPQKDCCFGFSLDTALPTSGAAGPVLWLAREKGKWSAVWVRRVGGGRLEQEERFSEKRDLPALPPDGTIRISVTSQNDAVTAVINGETVFENLNLSKAFYDSYRAGRAPYLLGSRVAVTALRARPLVPTAQSDMWLTDFEKAKTEAARSKRPILAFFTGSDWCVWCARLKAEVLGTRTFVNFATDNLILFEADFPQENEQPQAIKDQNAELMGKYEVKGFPTVLLLDAEGRILGQTGYQKGGAAAYVAHLKEMLGQAAGEKGK